MALRWREMLARVTRLCFNGDIPAACYAKWRFDLTSEIISGQRDKRSAEDAALERFAVQALQPSHGIDTLREERLTERIHDHVRSVRDSASVDPTSIYLMFDEFGQCLYVGITRNAAGRVAQHAASKPWYPFISEIRFEHYDSRDLAALRERWLIAEFKPVYNVIRGAPFTGKVHQAWRELLKMRWGFAPRWPLLEGFSIPLTTDERTLDTPVDTRHQGGLGYDAKVRSTRELELFNAVEQGRDVIAARRIAERVQASDTGIVEVMDAIAVVDDYTFVAVAGLLILTAEDGPLVRTGPYLMERSTYRKSVLHG